MGQPVCRGLRPGSVDEENLEVEVNWVSADPMFQPIPSTTNSSRQPILCDNHRVRQPSRATTNSVRKPIPFDNQFLATTNCLRLPSRAIPVGTRFRIWSPTTLVYCKRRENGATNTSRQLIPCDNHRVRQPSRATTNSCDTRGEPG